MLAACRRIVEGQELVRRGEWVTWDPQLLLGRDLHGATVGIVGYGRIGRAVARRVEGFGARVVHSSRSGGVPLERAARRVGLRDAALPAHPGDGAA